MKYLVQLFFRITLLSLTQLIYRVRRVGTENVPPSGGVLLLSNHVSYIDSFIIYLACPRPVRFVFEEHYLQFRSIAWFLCLFDGIPIRPSRAKEAIQRTAQALIDGDVVCFFPEGELSRTGVPGELKKGFELIVHRSKCPVVPVFMDGLWRSIFSFEQDKYFKKRPHGLSCPLQVAFGLPIPTDQARRKRVREGILEASVEAFAARREMDRPLEVATVRALKRHRRRSFLLEQGKSAPREWTRGRTLGLAMAMARTWMASPPEGGDRVGILLPAGPTPAIIGLGLFLAGKTPVYLPLAIEEDEREAIFRTAMEAGIKTVITSKVFMPHFMDSQQGKDAVFIDFKAVLSRPGRGVLSMEQIRALIEPAWLTNWRLDFKVRNPDREAIGLIPGPSEEAVFLSSRELHQNALQITSVNFVKRDESLFCEMPMNQSAGIQLGLWAPLLGGGRIISRSLSRQKDSELLANMIPQYGVSLISGTPDFFKKIKTSLSIAPLSHAVVFGRIQSNEINDWEAVLQMPLCRGWECRGRVTTMSRPDPNEGITTTARFQIGRNPRSVGRFLPGIAGKIESGALWIRFGAPENGGKDSSWIAAWPHAEIDEQGFVYLSDLDGA